MSTREMLNSAQLSLASAIRYQTHCTTGAEGTVVSSPKKWTMKIFDPTIKRWRNKVVVNIIFRYSFKALLLDFFHILYILETNTLLFTPLHLFDNFNFLNGFTLLAVRWKNSTIRKMLKIAPEYIHTYVTSITFDTYMHLILNTYQSKKKKK